MNPMTNRPATTIVLAMFSIIVLLKLFVFGEDIENMALPFVPMLIILCLAAIADMGDTSRGEDE